MKQWKCEITWEISHWKRVMVIWWVKPIVSYNNADILDLNMIWWGSGELWIVRSTKGTMSCLLRNMTYSIGLLFIVLGARGRDCNKKVVVLHSPKYQSHHTFVSATCYLPFWCPVDSLQQRLIQRRKQTHKWIESKGSSQKSVLTYWI